MASGLFCNTFNDLLDATLTTLDLTSETNIKYALYDTTGVSAWNFDSATAAYTVTNEISGTGYTAKGDTLTTTAVSYASGTLTFDADPAEWTTATLSGVYGGLVFDDSVTTPVADPAVVGVDFGGAYQVTAGTLTVQHHANGIFTIDFTP